MVQATRRGRHSLLFGQRSCSHTVKGVTTRTCTGLSGVPRKMQAAQNLGKGTDLRLGPWQVWLVRMRSHGRRVRLSPSVTSVFVRGVWKRDTQGEPHVTQKRSLEGCAYRSGTLRRQSPSRGS